jgi:hypothetical protein
MNTKELLEELTKKLERLHKLEEAFGDTSNFAKRKHRSAEFRAKISAAQKKRWAKVRAEKAKAKA